MLKVSAVVPTYNGAQWLPKSIPKLDEALIEADIRTAEILIVNDGSIDETLRTIKKIKTKTPLRVVSQDNGGRFLARKTGTTKAKYDHLLFVDTRVFIGKQSLKYVIKHYDNTSDRIVWNSHVNVAKEGNMYARFWDAIAYIAWRKYFSNPRDLSYGIKDFDHYPKGTTCFFVPKSVMIEANEWFENNTKDMKYSNDDTLLIRHIAESHNINLSPHFSCLYHARSSLGQFTKHVYHRGKVFVDGFLRRDGNRFYWPLVAFLLLSCLTPVLLIVVPWLVTDLLLAGLVVWLVAPLLLVLLGTPAKDAASFFLLVPIFAVYYGLGIWSAFLKLYALNKLRTRNA